MRSTTIVLLGLALGLTPPARAQVLDHLQCFKVKDPTPKASYSADLLPRLGVNPSSGCTIKTPAKLLCVDTRKENVRPTPPGAAAGQAGQPYLCYKLKCSAIQPPVLTAKDQFGIRALQVKGSNILCAPVSQLTVGTVTTSTTTTTTIPTCVEPFVPVVSDLVAAFSFRAGPAGVFELPTSCGSPLVCCPDGQAAASCGPAQISFMTASATLTATADPNRFTFRMPATLTTVVDVPMTFAGLSCGVSLDSTRGSSPTMEISGELGFRSDRLRMDLLNVVVTMETADVQLRGGVACTLADAFIGLARGQIESLLADTLRSTALCRPCGSTGVAQCLP